MISCILCRATANDPLVDSVNPAVTSVICVALLQFFESENRIISWSKSVKSLPSFEVVLVFWISAFLTKSVHVKHHGGKWSETFDTINLCSRWGIFWVVKLFNPFASCCSLDLIRLEKRGGGRNDCNVDDFLKKYSVSKNIQKSESQ